MLARATVLRSAVLLVPLGLVTCREATIRDDEPDFTTTSTSSSEGGDSSSGVDESSSSGLADTTSAESSGSSGTTGIVVGCGDGVHEPGELCIGELVDTWAMGADARALVVADFNADGRSDFATLDATSLALDVRVSDGDRSYGELSSFPWARAPSTSRPATSTTTATWTSWPLATT